MDERENRRNILENAYSKYQKGRFLATAGRALIATSSIWGPIATALGLILIFTITIVAITGGPGAASEIPIEQATPRVASGLFNISGATPQEIEEINNILSASLLSSTYADLLTSGVPVEITIESGGCSGLVDRGSITLYNFSSCGGTFKRYLVLHEMGPIVHARNGRLAQTFDYQEYARLEPQCYDSEGYLITYPKPEGKANAFNESFAEAIALYTIYRERHPLNDFPNQCPNTYNWVRNNIFR